MALACVHFSLWYSWCFCPENAGRQAFLPSKRQKDLPLEPSSAVSWIAFVSRRFWGTQKEALYFFKVAQKASLSGELWRANILLFEMSILIFDILILKKKKKKDTEPCFWALYFAGQRGSALFPRAWSLILGPGVKMDHVGSLLIGVFTLPHPTHPGVVTGWKVGWWRSHSSSREVKRADSWLTTSSTWLLQF